MFRKVTKSFPRDPRYPADLEKLGYFIDTIGHIRKIEYPEESFQFHYTNDQRHNEVHREAMQQRQRDEVLARLDRLGIGPLYLPQLTSNKPAEPHVPILAPPAEILRTRKDVVVIANDSLQDLGVLAYRQLQRDLGLNGGSVVNFAKGFIMRSAPQGDDSDLLRDMGGIKNGIHDVPALIVTNPGQLLYSHKLNNALSVRSWSAMERASYCHETTKIHDELNIVPQNKTPQEHLEFVFKNIINNPEFVAEDARVFVIGIEDGAAALLAMLDDKFDKYGIRITAMALVQSGYGSSAIRNAHLRAFLQQRAREWTTSPFKVPNICIAAPAPNGHHPGEVRQSVPQIGDGEQISKENDAMCPVFSGAGGGIGECIFTNPEVYGKILDFFEDVGKEPTNYVNPDFTAVPYQEEALVNEEDGKDDDQKMRQQEIDKKRVQIEGFEEALSNMPKDVKMLEVGRIHLEERLDEAKAQLKRMLIEQELHGLVRQKLEWEDRKKALAENGGVIPEEEDIGFWPTELKTAPDGIYRAEDGTEIPIKKMLEKLGLVN